MLRIISTLMLLKLTLSEILSAVQRKDASAQSGGEWGRGRRYDVGSFWAPYYPCFSPMFRNTDKWYLRSSQVVAGRSSQCLNILPAGSLFKQVIASGSCIMTRDIMTRSCSKSLPVYLTVAARTATNEFVDMSRFFDEVWNNEHNYPSRTRNGMATVDDCRRSETHGHSQRNLSRQKVQACGCLHLLPWQISLQACGFASIVAALPVVPEQRAIMWICHIR